MADAIENSEWKDEIVPALIGGLRLDLRPDLLQSGEVLEAEGVVFEEALARVDTGYAEFAEQVRGTPREAYQFFKSTGAEELVLVTTATVYTLSADNWEYVSDGTDTTLSAPASASAATVDVASAAGFGIGDHIGIRLENTTQHKAEITNVSGTTLTISPVLPSSAASGAAVIKSVGLSGNLETPVQFLPISWEDKLLFTNNSDPVMVYDGLTCVPVPNLPGGGNTTCRSLALFMDHILLIGTNENGVLFPQRVRWSDTGDYTEWSSGNAGWRDLIESDDFVLCALPLGPYMIVYAERRVIRLEWVGSADRLFNFETMIWGEGPVGVGAVVDMGDYHIFWGNANMYSYRGGFDIDAIADKIRKFLWGTAGAIDATNKERMLGLYVEELDEVWFLYPSVGSENLNRLLRMRPDEQVFALRIFANAMSGFGFYQATGSRRWIDLVGPWTAQNFRWNSVQLLANAPSTLLCSADPPRVFNYNYTASDDFGVVIPYVIETKDFSEPGYMFRVDHLSMRMSGTNVTVQYSIDGGSSWTTLGVFSPGANTRIVKKHMNLAVSRIRFRISGASGGFRLFWMRFSYILESPDLSEV